MVLVAVFNGFLMLAALLVSALLYFRMRRFDQKCIESRGTLTAGALVVKQNRNGLMEVMGTDPDRALYLLQLIAGYELGVSRESLAREIALRVATTDKPSIEGLVRAWKVEPELSGFVDAIEAATTELRDK